MIYRKIINNKQASSFIAELKEGKLDFSVREGSECVEIFLDDTHYVFASKKAFPQRKINLFKTVSNDVKKWIAVNKVVMPIENKQTHYNYDFDAENKILSGTDLNHAYWRIAWLLGVISEKTYISGLDDDCKELRLATLSVLGRQTIVDVYKNGIIVDKQVHKQGDKELKSVYNMIRYTCYDYMRQLSEMLGDDFFCWKTDGIYYNNTDANIMLVQGFFDDKNLTYKQLSY